VFYQPDILWSGALFYASWAKGSELAQSGLVIKGEIQDLVGQVIHGALK
jgi:hypothetical protein